MKTTHTATALVTVLPMLLAAAPARAEAPTPCDGTSTEDCAGSTRAWFTSDAAPPVIAAEACTLHATLAIDGKPRQVDVWVEGRRCASGAPPDGAIAINVRLDERESKRRVAMESVASDLPIDIANSVVVALERELRERIERVTNPPAPAQASLSVVTAPAAVTLPDVTVPRPRSASPAAEGPFDQPATRMRSPKMVGWGVALIAIGGVTMFAGTFGGLASAGSPYGNGGAGGLAGVIVGGAIAGIGIPLVIVGKRQVPVVSASVSPTGGALRVAF